MEVYIEKTQSTVLYEKACTAQELLEHLNIIPSTVLIVKNGEVILPDEALSETDEVKLLSVVSGG
jgi:sulfur carrier protein ThiS